MHGQKHSNTFKEDRGSGPGPFSCGGESARSGSRQLVLSRSIAHGVTSSLRRQGDDRDPAARLHA